MKKTPLNKLHRDLSARMVDFGGWDMPVQYSGVIDEHLAVRQAAGLFELPLGLRWPAVGRLPLHSLLNRSE